MASVTEDGKNGVSEDTNEGDSKEEEWQEKLNNIEDEYGPINPTYTNSLNSKFGPFDVGLYGKSGSYVKVADNGAIELFSGPSLGIRIDPSSQSITMLGYNSYTGTAPTITTPSIPATEKKKNVVPSVKDLVKKIIDKKAGTPKFVKSVNEREEMTK